MKEDGVCLPCAVTAQPWLSVNRAAAPICLHGAAAFSKSKHFKGQIPASARATSKENTRRGKISRMSPVPALSSGAVGGFHLHGSYFLLSVVALQHFFLLLGKRRNPVLL